MSMSLIVCLCILFSLSVSWFKTMKVLYNASFDNLNIRGIACITWYIHMILGMLLGCYEVEISLFSCNKNQILA